MKQIKIAVLALLTFASISSCNNEDFGDNFNQDAYGIYSADNRSLLSGAIVNFSQNGGSAYFMAPQLYVQYQSQVTYTTEQQYGLIPGSWSRYYVNQIKNLDTVIKNYENPTPEMLEQGSAQNMTGVAKIFRAIIYKRLTDTYGDAPYSEANKGINLPKFDKQEVVYKSLINELKAGRDMLNSSQTKPTGDPLYDGDVVKWKKLANSVIMQAALQLSKKYPSPTDYAATEFKAALASGPITAVADEAWFRYSSATEVVSPINAFRSADYRISAELAESLKGSASPFNRTSNRTPDQRLTIYGSSMTTKGLPFGYSSTGLAAAGYSTTGTSNINVKLRGPESPIQLMTAGYTFLNRAEAAQKGWTTENAAAMLTTGITLNYNALDSKYATALSASAAAYAAARVADAGTVGFAQVIGEEKWVALFMNGFDAWSEYRRTGYPNLKPAPNAVNGGVIPTRIIYPTEEANFNSANYKEAVSRLVPGEDTNTAKFWWLQ